MDPNATLSAIRNVIFQLSAAESDSISMLKDIAEEFEALDEWLCAGGFLPTEWESNRKSSN